MENFDTIHDEIEKTLNTLTGIKQAEPNPFFYTRLKARMEKELLEPKVVFGFQFKPIYAYSTLALILLLNIFSIFTLSHKQMPSFEKEPTYNLYNANDL
jgi:hypothetical protein